MELLDPAELQPGSGVGLGSTARHGVAGKSRLSPLPPLSPRSLSVTARALSNPALLFAAELDTGTSLGVPIDTQEAQPESGAAAAMSSVTFQERLESHAAASPSGSAPLDSRFKSRLGRASQSIKRQFTGLSLIHI